MRICEQQPRQQQQRHTHTHSHTQPHTQPHTRGEDMENASSRKLATEYPQHQVVQLHNVRAHKVHSWPSAMIQQGRRTTSHNVHAQRREHGNTRAKNRHVTNPQRWQVTRCITEYSRKRRALCKVEPHQQLVRATNNVQQLRGHRRTCLVAGRAQCRMDIRNEVMQTWDSVHVRGATDIIAQARPSLYKNAPFSRRIMAAHARSRTSVSLSSSCVPRC